MYQGRSEHVVQHVILRYHVGIWRLAGFEVRAEPKDVRCHKCTNMRSSYRFGIRDVCLVYSMVAQTITSGAEPLCRYRM